MDPIVKILIFGIAAGTTIGVIRTVANVILKIVEVNRRPAVDETTIRDRLERIEIAVDAIAIEVERLGEHHRFNAQLALNRPEPLPAKVVTPH